MSDSYMDFDGSSVLITGAATGIGRATALAFAGRGAPGASPVPARCSTAPRASRRWSGRSTWPGPTPCAAAWRTPISRPIRSAITASRRSMPQCSSRAGCRRKRSPASMSRPTRLPLPRWRATPAAGRRPTARPRITASPMSSGMSWPPAACPPKPMRRTGSAIPGSWPFSGASRSRRGRSSPRAIPPKPAPGSRWRRAAVPRRPASAASRRPCPVQPLPAADLADRRKLLHRPRPPHGHRRAAAADRRRALRL